MTEERDRHLKGGHGHDPADFQAHRHLKGGHGHEASASDEGEGDDFEAHRHLKGGHGH